MRFLKRLTALVLCMVLCAAVPAQAADIKIGKLTEGLTLLDAVTMCCAIAEECGAVTDFSTLKVDAGGKSCSVQAGVFTLTVGVDANALATSVSISAAYLDADYAQQMGKIFGMMLANFSGITSLAELNGLDFNAFNTLTASRQTLISGDYKVTLAVDPDSATPYSLTLALNAAVPVEGATTDPIEDARLILGRMNIDVSAAFLYDEKTDSNGKLGTEGSYHSKINFARTALAPNATVSASLDVQQGGSIEVFANQQQAIERSAYIVSRHKIINLHEYHFVHGNALLRLSTDTTPEDVGRIVASFIIAVDGDMAPGMDAVTATPTPNPTAAPAADTSHMKLHLKHSKETSVTLQWETAKGASYKVEYQADGGEWTTRAAKIIGTGKTRDYTVSGLDTGRTYRFRVTETVSATSKETVATLTAQTGAYTPTATPRVTATPKPTATPTPTPTATPRPSVKVGDKVTFGTYEQDGKTSNGKEAIEWLVLEVKGGNALLISVYALDVYNTYWGSRTWDNSTLRTWMNGTFYDTAFSAAEQSAIVTSAVSADKHPYYTSDPGKATRDKVFCLSYVEANTLMTASQRKCKPTTYARQTRKVYTAGGYCYWWLRTPGKPTSGASIVCTDGSYDYDASYDGFCYGVRPCIRVPADSPLLKKN